jgi:hypothetical protein
MLGRKDSKAATAAAATGPSAGVAVHTDTTAIAADHSQQGIAGDAEDVESVSTVADDAP